MTYFTHDAVLFKKVTFTKRKETTVTSVVDGSLKSQQHAGEEASNILGDKLHQASKIRQPPVASISLQ